jgi:hypothetical protein
MDGRLGRFMKAALWSTSSNRFAMRFSALLNRNSDYRNLWWFTFVSADQIKQHCFLQRNSFISDVYCRSGQVVQFASPRAFYSQ